MAIIKRKNGTYDAEVYVNSQRVAMKRGFKTKTAAQEYQDQIKFKHMNGGSETKSNADLLPGEKPMLKAKAATFEDLLEAFKRLHLPKTREQTQERYLIDINQRLLPAFKFMKLDAFTPEMVLEMQADLLKTMKPKSVNNCIAVLNCMFNFGIMLRMVKDNPCKPCKSIKVGIRAFSWWNNWDDVQRFLNATAMEPLGYDFFRGRKDPCAAAYRVAIECGLRLGEVIGLSKNDIDFDRCQIHVHRQWLVKKKDYGATKHNQIRTVGFDPESELCSLLKEAVAKSKHPEAIFVNLKGERMRSDKLAGIYFAEWIEKLGLPKITFHDLRHTFASWFMIRGGNIWELMEVLGHSNIQTTMRYAHLSKEIKRVPSFNANKKPTR